MHFSSQITRILHVLIVYIDVIARIVLSTSAMLFEPCHDNVSAGVVTSLNPHIRVAAQPQGFT